jgi:hypothetical protein
MDHRLIYLSVYENYSTARAIDEDSTRFSKNVDVTESRRVKAPSDSAKTGSKQKGKS